MRAKPIHTLSLLASAIAMALPSTTFALGLGKLTVQSSIGQPLAAQIDLTSAAKDELDSLAAKVADPALYRQNNLSYQGVLARARVTLERNANGQPYLRVVTAGPVNEPYLDLMVELNWASGRVVREYTFLLDPPGIAPPTPAVEPMAPVRAGVAPATRAAAPAARADTASSPRGGGDTYTVKRGDTLARIANQNKPEAVSLEQMLVALFRGNPTAFDDSNMNRLRAGTIVTIPSPSEAAATPAAEATHVVRVQAADWRSYRDRVAGAAPASEGAGGRQAGGRIGTAVQERTPAAPAGRDQVRISREAGQGKGGGVVAEDAVARDRALKDAQSRIAELEKTLKDLQRAVEMRNQTMAQLQHQAEAGRAKAGGAAQQPLPPATPIAVAPTALAPAPASKAPEPKPAEPVTLAAPTQPEAAPAVATAPPKTEAPVVTPVAPAVVPAPAPAPAAGVGKTAATVSRSQSKTEPSMLDDVLTNTPSWAIGAGALAVLAGFAALLAARRRRTTKFEDSIISGTDIKSNTVFGSTGGGVVNTGENSLSTDFSREGLGNIDTDEVDPIAEAEVYLAYGRDAQAEEILKDALKKDPQRQEVYLKLLEIHAQHNKPSAFETVAAELYSVSHGQGETWHKAVALGRQLDPNNPLFAENGSGAAAAAAAAAAGAAALAAASPAPVEDPGDVLPAAFDEPMHAQDVPPVPVGVADIERDRGLDFRLDDEISIAPTSGAKAKSPADILAGAQNELEKTARHTAAGITFDHDMAAAEPSASARSVEDRIRAARGADPKFDLDFQLDDAEKPAPLRPVAPEREHALQGAGAAAALARPQAAIELDKLDLSFDPDRTTFEDPTPSVLDGQWHDAATKLDLAKAYQEMGDVEGAREILQEVLHEGDEQQKVEAEGLLAKLS